MVEQEQEALIVYKEEDESIKQLWADIISTDDNFLTFRTKENIISIPLNRILKIKKRDKND